MAQVHPQTVLQNTLQAFTQTTEVPANGTDLIKDWMSVLKNADGAEAIHEQLSNLYDEVLNPEPNPELVKQYLTKLASHAQAASRTLTGKDADEVSQLADRLRDFASDLTGVGDDDQLDRNQPDATTVYANTGDRLQALLTTSQETLAGGLMGVAPEQGTALLEDWIAVAQSDPSAEWLAAPMRQLIDAIAKGDTRKIETLMRDLAGTAQEYANNGGAFSTGLSNLATALISFARPLNQV